LASQMIQILMRNGQNARALEVAQQQITLGGGDLSRYKMALKLAESISNVGKIKEIIDLCLAQNSNLAAAYALAGEYYLAAGNTSAVEQSISKILMLDTASVEGYILKAELDTTLGKTDDALEAFRRAISFDQYAGRAINGLAWTLIDKKGDIGTAVNEATSAISTDNSNASYYLTQGWAYYKMGKYNFARGSYEKALKLAPDDPLINYYAGINYIKDNNPVKAKTSLKKAAESNLDAKIRKEAETALNSL
jgi:tetratricopeptide (TPR) repeat protein